MNLISIVLAIIAVGVLLSLVNDYIPMAEGVKKLLNAVVIIVLVVWLLKEFGMMTYLSRIHF
jgi:hypothetical protein